ncbi:MAG: cellulase family glycosylhydrolase [Planctomycetes bacterium]|nr:cellulase family glycosylhydrolase [Planctomycetota bacterium]
MKKTCLITAMILMVLMSSASYSVTPAGPLSVNGNKIVDQNDQPVSFAGMSYFWTNDGWGGSKYYNADCLNWLVSDWNVTIVRAAMGVEDGGGYIGSPTNNKDRLKTIVDASIAAGIYVLIDWHSHHAEDYQTEAIAFFEEMATTYGGYDNVIYEIYNEPLSGVSWPNTIKPYAEAVIAAIRAIDPDNLIIVGSPEWSQRVDLPAGDPITGYINIAYTIHFYPDMGHTQWLRDRGTAAMNAGIALMATEWGPKGTPGHSETVAWMDWCELNYVSHTAWAVNDKDEPWSILDPWIGMETGGWDANDLSTRGQILKDICLNWDGTAPPPPEGVNIALNQPTARSSVENSSYESANAVDGSGSTRWSSQFSDPQWIYVDLGAQKAVDSVRLNWEAAYGTSYQIQVSDDASAWTDVYSTSSGNGGIEDIDLGGVVTRYVRMYGTQRATSYGYSLWEFEVYGSPPVLLYQNYDYGGWSAGFGSGSYTMADIIAAGGVNDDASSLLISPGYTVTLYEDDNFSGSSLVLTADTPNLGSYAFNDMLSSMTIVKDTGTGVYQESGGVCTMEAENATVDQRSDDITWVAATGQTGYIGSGYMTPPDNTGSSVVWSTGCELAWDVDISTAGTYYMAVRRIALDNGDDSARVGVNGAERDDNTFNGIATSWQWSRGTDFDLGNLSAGTHTIQIRRREDGFCVDRVMIADSWSKLPADGSTEAGPAESPTGGEPPDITPPAAPTGLSATAGDATVSLDWDDNSEPDLAVYDVYRSTTTGGPYSVIDFDLTSSDYIDNSVSNGTTYYYVVTAVDTSNNESGYSSEASATPQGAPATALHVADIAMSTKTRGPNVNGIATVTVVDAGGVPVEGATVSGHWSGLTSDSDSGITVADGTVSLSSNKLKNPSGTFTFTVDNITKAGWTYDSAANVETSDSITVP